MNEKADSQGKVLGLLGRCAHTIQMHALLI